MYSVSFLNYILSHFQFDNSKQIDLVMNGDRKNQV